MKRTPWVRKTEFRYEVLARDDFRCVMCSATSFLEVHHRKLRSRGGADDHPNCVCVCAFHHRQAHSFPNWSRDVGLTVPSWADPVDWPLLLNATRQGWVEPMLWQCPAPDGTWVARAPHPDQQYVAEPWGGAA